MRKSILIAVLLIGFTAIISQIILIRELIIVFYGNELSLGIILACWLFWGAAGSWVLGRFADRIKNRIATLARCQVLLSLLLPSAIVAIRSIKLILKVAPGEIIGFPAMAYSSLLVLAPICIILGFLFTLGCRIYTSRETDGAYQIGYVYILEAIGASIGGLLCSFLLIRYLGSLHTMMALSLLNLGVAFLLPYFKSRGRFLARGLILFLIIIGHLLFFFRGVDYLDRLSLDIQWKGFDLLSSRNSIYGNITVTRRGAQRSFFSNGLHIFTVPDELSSEEAVHFALAEHPDPKKVLLVGGGLAGLLKEALKHPVDSVHYVELDPLIIQMAKEHLYPVDSAVLQDRRVRVINIDGRLFIKNTRHRYDSIIINLPDPFTAQLNRFYTLEFFKEVKSALTEGGVLSFGVASSENYVSGELQKFLGSIHQTLSGAFAEVKVIPGEVAYFLASPKEGALTYDYKILMKRLKKRGVRTKYVQEHYLFSRLSQERIDYLEDRIGQAEDVKINRDFRPICYYYDMVLWSTYFKSFFQKVFKAVSEVRIWIGAAGLYLLIILPALLKPRFPSIRKRAVLVAVATTGFAEIAFEVTVLVSFQAIYGYMYYKLGLILTSFMVGLTLGGWWMTKIMGRLKSDITTFVWIQVAICIYPLILPPIFWWLASSSGEVISLLGADLIFPLLPIIAGLIGGLQFPLANKIYLESKKQVGGVAGLTYGMDLLGACAGAFLASAFLLPLLGIPKTCLVAALLSISSLILLVSFPKREKS